MKATIILILAAAAICSAVPETLILNKNTKISSAESEKTLRLPLTKDATEDLIIDVQSSGASQPILHISLEENPKASWVYGQIRNELIAIPKNYLKKDSTVLVQYSCEACETVISAHFGTPILEVGQLRVLKLRKGDEMAISLKNMQVFNRDLKVVAYNLNKADLDFSVSIGVLLNSQ